MRVARHAVVDEVIENPRDVQPHSVREMPAVGQIEPQHGVARLDGGEIDRHIRLAAGMGLHIGMFGAEHFLGPIASQILDHVDIFAAAVIPPAGIALGIFIGQHAADRLHDGRAGVVFAGDHLQAVLLAIDFFVDRGPNLGVLGFHEIHGRHTISRRVERESEREWVSPLSKLAGRSSIGNTPAAHALPLPRWPLRRAARRDKPPVGGAVSRGLHAP